MDGHSLLPYLKQISRRTRLRDGWNWMQDSFWLALLLCLLVLAAGRICPVDSLLRWATAPLGLWLILLPGYALLRPQSPLQTARVAESELGLKERLSTSLVLSGMGKQKPSEALLASFRPELVERQHEDALHAIRSIQPRQDFPLLIHRRPLLYAGAALVVILALIWLPNPMDEVLRERQAVAREAERQAERIEKLRDEVAKANEMTPEERDELLRKLDELARQLRNNTGDREQALADVSRLEESLRNKIDPRSGQKQAMLEALAAQLQSLENNEGNQQGNLDEAAKAVEQLAEQMKSMTPEEREALAQQLAQMATRAAQAGDSQLAQSFSALSQAAQSGDSQQASDAAKQAAQSLKQAKSDLANQRTLNQSLSQLQSSRQSLANAGQQGRQAAQSGQSGQAGQNSQNNQAQGQNGQGQGQGQQPGGGGGTTANTLPSANRIGQAGNPQGEARPGGEGQLDSQVYVPREKRDSGDGELFFPGQDTNQGETTSREQQDPLGGVNNPSLIPYQGVYQSYVDAASQAMDQSFIPPGLKDYVKNYFSQLEP